MEIWVKILFCIQDPISNFGVLLDQVSKRAKGGLGIGPGNSLADKVDTCIQYSSTRPLHNHKKDIEIWFIVLWDLSNNYKGRNLNIVCVMCLFSLNGLGVVFLSFNNSFFFILNLLYAPEFHLFGKNTPSYIPFEIIS